MAKFSYINLINLYWERSGKVGMTCQSGAFFFYLLHRINRSRWQGVAFSDHELARLTKISRPHLPSCREALKKTGIITFRRIRTSGRGALIEYRVSPDLLADEHPSAASAGDTGSPAVPTSAGGPFIDRIEAESPFSANGQGNIHSPTLNGKRNDHAANVMVNELTANGNDVCHSVSSTPIYISYKNDLRHNSPEEAPAGRCDVEGAAERMRFEKERAARQGAEALKAFLDPYGGQPLEIRLMKSCLDETTYRRLAEEVIDDWTEAGVCHDAPDGTFDIKGALRHLQNALRRKADDHHRRLRAPKSRDEKRRQLMQSCLDGMLNVEC